MPTPPGFNSQLPFNTERIGAVAIYCSDGRYNEQFDEFLHSRLKLPRYDRLVVPGGPGILAGHVAAYREEEALVEQLKFLIHHHELERVVLISHRGCGFYLNKLMVPAHRLLRQQEVDLSRAAERIRGISGAVSVEPFIAEAAEGRVKIDPAPPISADDATAFW
ncbi:MAG: carbonic anhydrase [Phycisphaerales bacterium]